MRLLALAVLLSPLLAASAPAAPDVPPLDQALKDARAEQASAEAETARLEELAAGARTEARRLAVQQAAAAQAIEAAEARITAADAQFRLASAFVERHREQLAEEQRPVSSLLAGLAVMAERPPLLALADGGGGTDELVRVGVLLDSTLPVIRSRTRLLSTQLAEGQRLEATALSARAELSQSQDELAGKRRQFAELERRALQQSLAAGGSALSSGDVAIAAAEQVERLRNEQSASASSRALAALLASEAPLPSRPFAASGPQTRPPFAYILPVQAPVLEGLGAVNDSGVRARGIRFATASGSAVTAPTDGVVRFSGPFRNYDGVVILDHGGGWMSLLVNVASPLSPGDKVRLGDPLGRSLGQTVVELSQNGRRMSPALIAGSSESLSKNRKGG